MYFGPKNEQEKKTLTVDTCTGKPTSKQTLKLISTTNHCNVN